MRVRPQVKAILLRHGRSYNGNTSWIQTHEHHLATIVFDHPAQHITYNVYR
jgi:hypothetical protein